LLLFWALTNGSPKDIAGWEILPNIYLLILVIGFVAPIPFVSRNGRSRTLATLKRISIGGLAEAQDGKFGDILLADALTSYAKVLGDLFVSLCMFFSSKHSSTGPPNRNCGGAFWVPFVIAIPSLIRLRQCLIEYFRIQKANQRSGQINPATGWGGVHLANALKYSTAFPVIILSALQRNPEPSKFGMSEATLFRLWLVAVFVNSGYSFYWDVARDWDLTLFASRKERENPEYPWGLRRNRYFHAKEFYYAAIVTDAMLRCTWSFKLSPHLDHFNDLEGGIFLMEALEVLRRWIWIFFRVETEWGELFQISLVGINANMKQCGIIVDQHPTIFCSATCRTSMIRTIRLEYAIRLKHFMAFLSDSIELVRIMRFNSCTNLSSFILFTFDNVHQTSTVC
jgi:hypothetical protein